MKVISMRAKIALYIIFMALTIKIDGAAPASLRSSSYAPSQTALPTMRLPGPAAPHSQALPPAAAAAAAQVLDDEAPLTHIYAELHGAEAAIFNEEYMDKIFLALKSLSAIIRFAQERQRSNESTDLFRKEFDPLIKSYEDFAKKSSESLDILFAEIEKEKGIRNLRFVAFEIAASIHALLNLLISSRDILIDERISISKRAQALIKIIKESKAVILREQIRIRDINGPASTFIKNMGEDYLKIIIPSIGAGQTKRVAERPKLPSLEINFLNVVLKILHAREVSDLSPVEFNAQYIVNASQIFNITNTTSLVWAEKLLNFFDSFKNDKKLNKDVIKIKNIATLMRNYFLSKNLTEKNKFKEELKKLSPDAWALVDRLNFVLNYLESLHINSLSRLERTKLPRLLAPHHTPLSDPLMLAAIAESFMKTNEPVKDFRSISMKMMTLDENMNLWRVRLFNILRIVESERARPDIGPKAPEFAGDIVKLIRNFATMSEAQKNKMRNIAGKIDLSVKNFIDNLIYALEEYQSEHKGEAEVPTPATPSIPRAAAAAAASAPLPGSL